MGGEGGGGGKQQVTVFSFMKIRFHSYANTIWGDTFPNVTLFRLPGFNYNQI